eukprot:NODE_487_length_6903_cov_0.412111.p1 type:complete len:595 gc:universal NODE_487_length_6903_cov_0.412111:3162-1378(-)
MKITKKLEQKSLNWSFEYFPPKTLPGKYNLFKRLSNMQLLGPTFSDITWGASGSTCELSLEIAEYMYNVLGMETCLHVTCTNLEEQILKDTLDTCQRMGMRNILALRGDPPKFNADYFSSDHKFNHAVDLVKYMRKNYGDYFCIGVAGYPEMHSDAVDMQTDLKYLKEKVEAGADYIVTQLFYDTHLFLKFVKDCRDLDINIPILPGIMPIQSYKGFMRMTSLCKTHVPKEIMESLEPIKEDDQLVKEYGIKLAVQMCKEIMQYDISNFHFYTLNLETSTKCILNELHLVPLYDQVKPLPWPKSLHESRVSEYCRPVYWSNRTESYLQRTKEWDEFPNGRWGNADSCAFGELDGYGCQLKVERGQALEMWGYPTSTSDLIQVFMKFCNREITMLPWCDQWSAESSKISDLLGQMNNRGFLTINSQPSVNGLKSSDSVHGWGPSNGYVYQRAYVECFVHNSQLDLVKSFNSDQITYYLINKQGDISTNHADDEPIALTWGVFPGKEVMQPTIMQKEALIAWKSEAYELWKEWANLYDSGSKSRELLMNVLNEYSLLTAVHNDFTLGSEAVFAPFLNYKVDGELSERLDSKLDLTK